MEFLHEGFFLFLKHDHRSVFNNHEPSPLQSAGCINSAFPSLTIHALVAQTLGSNHWPSGLWITLCTSTHLPLMCIPFQGEGREWIFTCRLILNIFVCAPVCVCVQVLGHGFIWRKQWNWLWPEHNLLHLLHLHHPHWRRFPKLLPGK